MSRCIQLLTGEGGIHLCTLLKLLGIILQNKTPCERIFGRGRTRDMIL